MYTSISSIPLPTLPNHGFLYIECRSMRVESYMRLGLCRVECLFPTSFLSTSGSVHFTVLEEVDSVIKELII